MGRNGSASAEGRGLSIVTDIPGRLRLRVPPGAAVMGLPEAIGRLDGVTGCAWSPRTRGLLVRYRPDVIAAEMITRETARQADVAVADAPARAPAAVAQAGRRSPIAIAVRDGVAALDDRVSRITGGLLDLGAVVPLALAVWAVREIARGQVGPLAWSTALWYAHGLFRDYNLPDKG